MSSSSETNNSNRAGGGTIENLPLIARSSGGGGGGGRGGTTDNAAMMMRRDGGGGGGGTQQGVFPSPVAPSSSVDPFSFTQPQHIGRTTAAARMTADGRQLQEQVPPSAARVPAANPTLYPQQQQANAGEVQNSPPPPYSHELFHDNDTFDGSEDTPAQMGGPTVTCRVCEAEIPIEGKLNQHVVRCLQCNEVTPIRAAPPGKKYVRCPCNCLLVCKATSTRIACPRQNCRRVITLVSGPQNSGVPGTAIRAPVGTCRVQCAYCQDIFMFNTLSNQLAICPHCRKSSSVGASYTRSRSLLYFISLLISSLFLIGVIVGIAHGNDSFFMFAFMTVLLFACAFLTYRFVFFLRIKASQVLGPL